MIKQKYKTGFESPEAVIKESTITPKEGGFNFSKPKPELPLPFRV